MKNDNLYKTLRIVCLILAIVCMALSLFKKAKAEGIPSDVKEEFMQYYNNNDVFTENQINEVSNFLDSHDYYCYVKDIRGSVIYPAILIWDYEGLEFGCDYIDTSLKYIQITTGACGIQARESFTSMVVYVLKYDLYSGITATKYTYGASVDKGTSFYIAYNPTKSKIFEDINQITSNVASPNYIPQYSNTTGRTSVEFIYTDEFYLYKRSGSSYQNLSFRQPITYFQNIDNIIPVTTSTTGFNVFKYNNLGTDTLRIVPPQNQVPVGTHSSNVSTVTFDLVIDGTTIPSEYNSESAYYYESLDYGRAYYEIPLSALLPSSLNDFDEVYVTNVRYVNTWSNQGGQSGTNTFVYVDKCYLKRSIGNDDIGQVSITHIDTDTGYTDTEINNINTMITNASTLQGSFDVEKNLSGGSSTPFSFSSFQDAVVREIECWHPTGTNISDWVSITIDGVTYDSGDNMYWLEYDSNSTQSFDKRYNYNVSPYSYVRENNYSGYYDIIYFIVHEMVYDSSGSGFSTLDETYTRYYYFISDRYYNKLILYREMDILTYIKLNNEIGEKTYNYLFDRLLNIDDNLYYYIKDKAVIDNDILDALEDIDNDMQFNLDIVMDLLNKILDALLNLNIELPEADYTDILTKLDTIIENQGTSDINDDWYQNYREWLYGINENDSYLSPHEYFYNIFGTLKTTFDSFTNNISFNAYLLKVEDFINHISGSTTDNLTIYLRDGIGDPGFNINNNYMYSVGGS